MTKQILYTINAKDSHSLSWDVEFDLINEVREIRSCAHRSKEPYFQIKIDILKDSFDEIDVRMYYMYPVTKYIKIETNLNQEVPKPPNQTLDRWTTYNTRGRPDLQLKSDVIYESNYTKSHANKWHNAGKLDKKILYLNNAMGYFVKFNLRFEFSIIDNLSTESYQLNNIKHFYNTNQFSDVVIQSSDGKEYNVHKLMLVSASAVFKAFFDHGTTECKTNIIKSHFESEVLETILLYIYNDAPALNKIPEKILTAADFYQLTELKDLCEQELFKKLAAENVIEMLELAMVHNAESLKQRALEFVKLQKADAFLKTEAWNRFESLPILKMIIEYLKLSNEITIVHHNFHRPIETNIPNLDLHSA